VTIVAIVARRRRLPGRHRPAVHALLVELEGLGNRDLPFLDQGPVRVAARARLRHLRPAGGRPGILLRQELMGRAVAIPALGGFLHAPGRGRAVDARLVPLDHRLMATLAHRHTELRGPLHGMCAMAALAVELRAVLAAVDALGEFSGGVSVADSAGDRRKRFVVGDLLDAGVAAGTLEASMDRGLEDGLVRVERDFLSLNLFDQPLVRMAAQAVLAGRPRRRRRHSRPGKTEAEHRPRKQDTQDSLHRATLHRNGTPREHEEVVTPRVHPLSKPVSSFQVRAHLRLRNP